MDLPNISNTFYRAGMIKAWRRGIAKMVELCKAANLPEPAFSRDLGGLLVTFYAVSGKMSDMILALAKENPNITIPQMAETTGSSTRTIERHIQVLKAQSRLERVGGGRGGRWRVLPGQS